MLKIHLAQINSVVGDVEGNANKIEEIYNSSNADIVITPECALSGYYAEDLFLNKEFLLNCRQKATQLADKTKNSLLVIGTPWLGEDGECYNTAIIAAEGKIIEIIKKKLLPNQNVFDEKRVFKSGDGGKIIDIKGKKVGILICEDMWHEEGFNTVGDAELVIVINASPFEKGKLERRVNAARKIKNNLVYINLVGGQDDLVYDGASFALNEAGEVINLMKSFDVDYATIDFPFSKTKEFEIKDGYQEMYLACMLGLKDYVQKNGFSSVAIGMSGGIDSALVAALAVDALGKKNVNLYMLPSKYTSQRSVDDASEAAKLLGVSIKSIPIDGITFQAESALGSVFAGTSKDVTEENIQSRARGLLLMAISNKLGHLVLATGNKSEYAVGYATLYGDMCGAYAPIKDVWKTEVYGLCNWRNTKGKVIPESIISREPTAELALNQRDQDKLPPYEILDGILKLYVEQNKNAKEIEEAGFKAETIDYVLKLLKNSEYKRKQSAPGVKISSKPFTRDWRMPITSKFNAKL